MKIGVFDSGIGGISVLARLRENFPYFDYFYHGDNLNAPYGNKTEEQLKALADKNIKILLEYNVQIIVVACNTVSTTCEKYLRKKYKGVTFCFVKPKITKEMIKNGRCKVFCTKKTAENLKKSKIYYSKKDKIEVISCPNLVNKIENGFLKENQDFLKGENLGTNQNIASIYLGCTHYPLILEYFREKFPLLPIFDGTSGVVADFLSLLIKIFNFDNKVKPSKKGKIFFIGRSAKENYQVYGRFLKKITKSGKNFTKSG